MHRYGGDGGAQGRQGCWLLGQGCCSAAARVAGEEEAHQCTHSAARVVMIVRQCSHATRARPSPARRLPSRAGLRSASERLSQRTASHALLHARDCSDSLVGWRRS
jgi:hypothetical protein